MPLAGKNIEDYEGGTEPVPKSASSSSGMLSYFSALTGGGAITRESIAPALEKTRLHLISKNVAADIAERICDGVRASTLKSTSYFRLCSFLAAHTYTSSRSSRRPSLGNLQLSMRVFRRIWVKF